MEMAMAMTEGKKLAAGQYSIDQALTTALKSLVDDYIKASKEMDEKMRGYYAQEKAKDEMK